MKIDQVHERLLRSLERERGRVEIYDAAIRCAVDQDLTQEWRALRDKSQKEVTALEAACAELDVRPEREIAGLRVIRQMSASLVGVMRLALEAGDRAAAELVACECLVLAETKPHLGPESTGRAAFRSSAA